MDFHLEMERYVSTMRTALDEVDNGIQIAKEDRQNKRKPKSLKCPRCQFQIGSMFTLKCVRYSSLATVLSQNEQVETAAEEVGSVEEVS